MTDVLEFPLQERVRQLQERIHILPGGPQPPDNVGMETRVAKLEDFAGDARERLARIETKLDQVSHDTGQFKWFLIGAVLTILLTVIGTSIGIQQMTVATFQAAGQQAQQPQQPTVIVLPSTAALATPAASQRRP